MHPLFGGITNRIEKIHQTRESNSANCHHVYTIAAKVQDHTAQSVQGTKTTEAGIGITSVILCNMKQGET